MKVEQRKLYAELQSVYVNKESFIVGIYSLVKQRVGM